ncbi:hypothetical protein [Helicobacter winghamensis]|uniref:Chemotaxis phosphatase CheX-like domain-containing protein n=1 Tax=Helicobacter winghamensis TaxID=157268 RepID=A0A2N3PHP5_9HELI|nr:hypothetical protein [Helicobacter winghamensis]EEO25519.1 hypothetical protein HWAG_00311 [Helicobacter winghamensis ATCC BAA-430]PKT78059.1 hypothetical protein BCM34_02295 [Helicobacter winghamensis]PKT78324.1 hypothetical protein BCM32_01050 [Helicobacter winghamensis]PKT78587.1 hypothetical protein BCM35_00585 [Helicobacter winghamensis]PKT80084.1 hypothetical protein BCM31_00090 [Helicobacter winghamensis]
MELIIKKAFMQVLKDTLGATPACVENKLLKGYLSSIDVAFEDGTHNTITFVSSKEFLEFLGEGLFGEIVSSELELRDLSQELANLTIGLAKVLAVRENVNFNITTPRVFGLGEFQNAHCKSLNFALNGATCSLFMHI